MRRPFLRYGECSGIKSLEHVQVEMTLSFQPRAHMIMDLTSPQGTKSQLLYYRAFDAITQRKVYKELAVTSLHFWGENPGDGLGWRVTVKSAKFKRPSRGTLYVAQNRIIYYMQNLFPAEFVTYYLKHEQYFITSSSSDFIRVNT